MLLHHIILLLHTTTASSALIIHLPSIFSYPGHSGNHNGSLFARQNNADSVSTCGYLNGNPSKPRTANSGYNCRVDTQDGLWGFCPTSVIAASDCGLAGSCVDQFKCSKGCGFIDKTQLTTFTCESTQQCGTAILTAGVDQTYTYIACGGEAFTDHYMITPTADPQPKTTKEPPKVVSTSDPSSSQPKLTQSQTQPSSTSSPNSHTTDVASQSKQASSSTVTSATLGANSPSVSPAADSGKPNNIVLIIGGVLGGLALLCISAIAIFYLWRRNQNQAPAPTMTPVRPSWGQKSEASCRPSRRITRQEMSASSIQPPIYAELAS
ncbi:hypothetical protein VHEMI08434 [[Torrubiella] hemipterigena]|uniref:Mid2 domain-containing protein n=1 Tax=[Torrubiella] hemipterigena TaxID=1531966 RepID=A0A0A1TDH6_9HYPO|nr:hypothetical protein VHEMI08434 [[Torrubiella] hemipterigena]